MFFKNSFRTILILAAAVLTSGCADKVGSPTGPSNSTTAIVFGVVRDSTSNVGIRGAVVELYSFADTVLRDSVSTGDTGFYKIENIPPGTYWLVISADNYHFSVDTVHLQAGSNIPWNRWLGRVKQSTITGVQFHIEDAMTGLPVLTALVDSVPVDNSGNITWYSSMSGNSFYSISAPGYLSTTANVYIILGEELFDTIRLVPHLDTLLAEYTFNNSSIDSSGKGHDGMLHGGTFTYDRFGNPSSALQLNGTTDYISVPNTSDLNFGNSESITLSFWVKCYAQNPSVDTHFVLRKADTTAGAFTGFALTNTQNAFYSTVASTASSLTRAESIGSNNQWHFIVYTYDGSGAFSCYYDNSEVDNESDSPVSRALRGRMIDSAPLLIGGDGTSSHAFKGILDDIRIYRGWLLPSQIDSLYHLNGWQ